MAAQWQLCITYFFAFTLSTGFFETQRSLYTVGISLLVVNIIIILIALIVGFSKNRKNVANEATIFKLRRQLAVEKDVDKKKFDNAWADLERVEPAATVRVLRCAAQLAERFTTTPVQGGHLEDVDDLMAEAEEVETAFHAATERLITEAGGVFKQGPLKKKSRVQEKMENDYNNDHRRVVDIVRDSGVFKTMASYLIAVERLMNGDCGLEIVRFKDRLADGGNSFGYRDLMMNLKLPGSEHIGELQLHLKSIIDIKPGNHRIYGLLRAVGWEDDRFGQDEVAADGSPLEVSGEDASQSPAASAPAPVASGHGSNPLGGRTGAGSAKIEPMSPTGSSPAEEPMGQPARTGPDEAVVGVMQAEIDELKRTIRENRVALDARDAEIGKLKRERDAAVSKNTRFEGAAVTNKIRPTTTTTYSGTENAAYSSAVTSYAPATAHAGGGRGLAMGSATTPYVLPGRDGGRGGGQPPNMQIQHQAPAARAQSHTGGAGRYTQHGADAEAALASGALGAHTPW